MIAIAITFPLVFGWIHFETLPPSSPLEAVNWYRAYVFGFPTFAFPIHSIMGFLIFHGLVWSSILVIAGVMLAMRRRMRDHGAAAAQHFAEDFLPLILLFAISATGLMLTASYTWMKGYAYDFLAILHAITVIFALLWLPFVKFFHIFQRPAQLGVSFYKDAGAREEQAICFAVFGSVSAMMPILKKNLSLGPVQVSVALAIPVLLGSLGRIPLGMLTDRYGGRLIFSVVMVSSIAPALMMGFVADYWQLIVCGFFIGVALASFSVGVGFVSGWYPPEKQGMALGVYGAGNIGQSLAAFGSPVLAAALGFRWGFWTFGVLLVVWLTFFWIKAQNAPRRAPAKTFGDMLEPLRDAKSWALSLYYFLTFGGFVAMAIYLPTFLTEISNFVRQLPRHERAVRRLAEVVAPGRRHLQRLPYAREFPRQVRDEGLERLLAFVLFHHRRLPRADPDQETQPGDHRRATAALK